MENNFYHSQRWRTVCRKAPHRDKFLCVECSRLEAASGAPFAPGNTGIPSDPQSAAVYYLVLTQTGLNLIGSPFVYNIQLLDQNGNPITYFTGTVTIHNR